MDGDFAEIGRIAVVPFSGEFRASGFLAACF
jgi:hypothetical protein